MKKKKQWTNETARLAVEASLLKELASNTAIAVDPISGMPYLYSIRAKSGLLNRVAKITRPKGYSNYSDFLSGDKDS